jgi:hypothetical protein
MAGSKSNYLEGALLDHTLGGPNYARPASVFAALFTVAPGEGSAGTEFAGSNYSRAEIPNDASNWPAAVGGVKQNGLPVTFPVLTGTIGPVVGVALFDAATGGNMLYYADLAPENQKTFGTNDVPFLPAGAFTITED